MKNLKNNLLPVAVETVFFIACVAGLVYAAWTGSFAVGIVCAVALIGFLAAVIKPV